VHILHFILDGGFKTNLKINSFQVTKNEMKNMFILTLMYQNLVSIKWVSLEILNSKFQILILVLPISIQTLIARIFFI